LAETKKRRAETEWAHYGNVNEHWDASSFGYEGKRECERKVGGEIKRGRKGEGREKPHEVVPLIGVEVNGCRTCEKDRGGKRGR